jgi:regulator of replication initiation timing
MTEAGQLLVEGLNEAITIARLMNENDALRAENEKLRAAFRVNMLRAFPSTSHEEIDAEINAAIVGEKQ